MSTYGNKTTDVITGLRAVADYLEANAERFDLRWSVGVEAFGLTAEQMADVAGSPGTWEKQLVGVNDDFMMLSQPFETLLIEVHAERDEVCEARPTGRKIPGRKLVTPAVYEDVEVDEIAWDCKPLLSNAR